MLSLCDFERSPLDNVKPTFIDAHKINDLWFTRKKRDPAFNDPNYPNYVTSKDRDLMVIVVY